MKKINIFTLFFILNASFIFSMNPVPGLEPAVYNDQDPRKDSAVAYYNKGMAKNTSGDFVEAIRWFTKAIQSDSSMVAAYLNRAWAKNKLLDYKSAIADYNTALKMKNLSWEEQYEAYYNRGLVQAALD